MGYQCSWDIGLMIKKPGLIPKVKNILKNNSVFEDYGIYIDGLEICADDCYGRYNDDDWEQILKLLKPYVEGDVIFCGEDNYNWRLKIENGKVIEDDGRVEFDDSYEIFIKDYKDKLTSELKKELKSWWVLQKI